MIKSKDLNKEVRVLDDVALSKEEVPVQMLLKSILKGITLVIKLLRDVRINQTTTMRAQGVKLVEAEEENSTKPDGKK